MVYSAPYNLALAVNPKNTSTFRATHGLNFLGHKIYPNSPISIDKKIIDNNLKSKMILQVHDELIFDVCEDELIKMKTIVKDAMENVVSFSVKLNVNMGVGVNWFDLK